MMMTMILRITATAIIATITAPIANTSMVMLGKTNMRRTERTDRTARIIMLNRMNRTEPIKPGTPQTIVDNATIKNAITTNTPIANMHSAKATAPRMTQQRIHDKIVRQRTKLQQTTDTTDRINNREITQ
jgi:hypothetical protein